MFIRNQSMEGINSFKEKFQLNPDITFLNFGSYGACPKVIFEDYQKWQLALERDPVQFITVQGVEKLKISRLALSKFINCEPGQLVFTPNPTHALNIVIKSLKLNPDDEILSTDLEYGAIDRTWQYYCKISGASYIRQKITLPIISKESFLENFWKGLTAKTKIIFISHITSSTGLILPVKEICKKAKELGLLCIIDGAHVPGHISLDLNDLKPDIYTGACHKWMMTPKACSFLYVKNEYQDILDPLIISWGYKSTNPSESTFFDYHQFNGTRDFSAYLTIPKALEFMQENDWGNISSYCRKLTQENAFRFVELLGSYTLAPVNNNFFGQLCSLPIKTNEPEKLYQLLYDKYKIEIPVIIHEDKVFMRYSIQAFNEKRDLDMLYDSLSDIISTTNLIDSKYPHSLNML